MDGKIKEQTILKCVNDLAVENYTMKEVFNMDSSVRLDAINNLGESSFVSLCIDSLGELTHAAHTRHNPCLGGPVS